MTKTWALKLSRYGNNANAIAPGLIETDMTRSIPQPVLDNLTALNPTQADGKCL
ncbi:MAG: SDR family oxidoreductase [Bdellovibrionota bacterium]